MYYIENLVAQSAVEGSPWNFKPTEQITDEIRHNKGLRQAWFNNPNTKHCFYSMVEPLNPNLRISKSENPPHSRTGFSADFDTLQLPVERITEAIEKMPIKPARIEKSLGGNWRLVWTSRLFFTGSFEYDQFIAKRAVKWLNLNILPCFDEQAFVTPTRYLCNGCQWIETGHGDIPDKELQAFLVECAREFDFKPLKTDLDIPLDVVEKALKEKYPHMNWPGVFEVGSQGPSFWIEGSTSPMSAIVKQGGMITFAAHATKQFYSWSDLLGPDFAKKFSSDAIAKATENIFWDDKNFYVKNNAGLYVCTVKDRVLNYLTVNCRLSSNKDKKTGSSQMDEALNFIYNHNDVVSTGSYAFQKPGIMLRPEGRILNTYGRVPLSPAAGHHTWGQGDSAWLCALWDHMFNDPAIRWHMLAWYQYYLQCAVNWDPQPGVNVFLAGIQNSGKTFLNRDVFGASVGGSTDVSEMFLGQSIFNSYAFEVPHWRIDDETVSGSPANLQRASNMLKRLAANQGMLSHAKFQKQSMIEFFGRLMVTLNTDTNSMRIIGPQDAATLEKTMIVRCNEEPFAFGSRKEVWKNLQRSIAAFMRVVLDLEIPDFVERYGRYGFRPYHDPLLLDRTNQSQSIAPFKELLVECLAQYKRENPEATHWRGTLTQLMRLLAMDPRNDHVIRGLKMEQVNRYLEQIQKEGLLECEAESGRHKTRIWVFPLAIFADLVSSIVEKSSEVKTETINTKNPFEK